MKKAQILTCVAKVKQYLIYELNFRRILLARTFLTKEFGLTVRGKKLNFNIPLTENYLHVPACINNIIMYLISSHKLLQSHVHED